MFFRKTWTSPGQIFPSCHSSILKTCQCLSPTITWGSRGDLVPSWKDWLEKFYETSLMTFLNMLQTTSVSFLNKEKVTSSFISDKKWNDVPLTAVSVTAEIIFLFFLLFWLIDSGMDPAEWAAKLEDRFYNNHAFKVSWVLDQPI